MPAPGTPRRRALAAALLALAPALVDATSATPGAAVPSAPSAQSAPSVALRQQRATILVLPPVAQPGTKVAAASAARTAITATFSPARVGRPVVLSRRTPSGWVPVATTRLNRRGLAEFSVPTLVRGAAARYRATASSVHGLQAFSTRRVSTARWGAPLFSDEFAGTALGGSWVHRVPDYDPAGLRTCAKGSPAATAVGDGALRLSVVPDPARTGETCTAYRADGTAIGQFGYRLNGHVSTAGHAQFRYGVAAARMKLQKSRGQHASFWLQPVPYRPQATSAADGGAEIDIIEWFGHGGNKGGLASFVYHPTSAGRAKVGGFVSNPQRFLSSRADRWWKKYHVFSVEWTPTAYVFRIDGRETWRTTSGISAQPQYPILSLLSSDYELKNLGGETRLPQSMYVDWVRVWQS